MRSVTIVDEDDAWNKITKCLSKFNLDDAEALSRGIHEFEERGGELSHRTDTAWLRLTERIQDCYPE